MAAPAASGAFAGAFAADIGVVDLDPRPGGAKLVPAVALDHRLHQLVLDPPGGIGRDPEPAAQLDVGQALLALSQQVHGAKPYPDRQLGAQQDGAGDQRQLIPTAPALQQLTVADLAILCCRAPRTLEALWPAPGEPRLPAGLLVRIEPLEGIVGEALRCCTRFRITIPQFLAECRW